MANDNKDLVVLPGSIPLASGDVRNEMTYLLPAGWDPVIEGDIDGDRAETTELEGKEPRFGQVNAARRVAYTLTPALDAAIMTACRAASETVPTTTIASAAESASAS